MGTPQTDIIRPFSFRASEEELADLRRRIKATRWPEPGKGRGRTQGVQLATIQKLARYWATELRLAQGARRGSTPCRSSSPRSTGWTFISSTSARSTRMRLPMIVTHGWPGSIIEQLKIIEPLTNPTAHGGSAADAFHVVIPSLPGYGFSGKPTAPGWNPRRIARAWATLMQRLGYTRYVAQGGDWGNAVTEQMALQEPPGLLGIHTNMPATVPADISKALASASRRPPVSRPTRSTRGTSSTSSTRTGLGYAIEMDNRPQTLYGIVDSPVGLAAWMIDHDARSQELIARVFDGKTEGPDAGRHPRQRHALLADEHRDLLGAPLLGQRAPSDGRLLRRAGASRSRSP